MKRLFKEHGVFICMPLRPGPLTQCYHFFDGRRGAVFGNYGKQYRMPRAVAEQAVAQLAALGYTGLEIRD